MIINKAYKFRLYPNCEQKILINKTFGCTRFIYNYYLNKKQELYKSEHKNLNAYDCIKDIKNLYDERPYLKEVDSCSLRCALFDLDNAYQKFFKEKIGFPNYKIKHEKNSYRTNYIKNTYKNKIYENIKLDLIKKEITLPKLKEVKIRGYRKLKEIKGKIINATISKELDNKYYVSVVYEENIEIPPIISKNIIGIDLGVRDLVITSDYRKYKNEKIIQKYENRIKMYQRRLSKKIKHSNNYFKLKQKLARLYQKIKNTRKYIINSITKQIIDDNDIIVIENLKT